MFRLLIDKSAKKDLDSLQNEQIKNILPEILNLENEPRPIGSKKLKGVENCWRIRIQNFRVVYEIDNENKIINILIVKHRKDVYKRKWDFQIIYYTKKPPNFFEGFCFEKLIIFFNNFGNSFYCPVNLFFSDY